jgi:hypothetical protein
MRRVRASNGRRVVAAVVAVDVTAAADMAAAGVTVDSEGAAAATSQLPLTANLILRADNSAQQLHWANLGRAGFEPAKA